MINPGTGTKPSIHKLFDKYNNVLANELPDKPMVAAKVAINLKNYIKICLKKNCAARPVPEC